MTNSIEQPCPDRVLDTVLGLLAESHLERIIDAPVQSAVASFDYVSLETDPYWRFIDTASHFYDRISQSVGIIYEERPAPFVQGEWMHLLETRYRTAHGSGFHLAYLDVLDDIQPVLSELAGIVISCQRERHAQWIYFKWIAGLPWADRCSLVKVLFDRYPFLPDSIRKCPPPFMADRIFELISVIVSVDNTVRDLLLSGTGVFGD